MRRINLLLREPLFHFLLIGASLFLIFGLIKVPGENKSNRIVVDAGQVEQLAATFKRTWMRPPTGTELSGLIENHVRDELYYREALAMGLDQGDPLIRRRMRQKLEFILEDLSSASEPNDQVLTKFLEQHADRFLSEPRFSFRQIYLNPDKRPYLNSDAAKMLANLQAGADPEKLGDPFLMGYTFEMTPQSVISRLFGDSFAEDIAVLVPGKWTGPLYSGVGSHLVLVTERKEGRLPKLAEVRDQVEREWLVQHRRELKNIAYQKIRQGYEVIIEPKTTGKPAGKAMAAGLPEERSQ
jgi:hypothetical protein